MNQRSISRAKDERRRLKAAAVIVLEKFGKELSSLEKYDREFVACMREIEAYIRKIAVYGIRKNPYTSVPISILKLIVKALNLYIRNLRILMHIKKWSLYDISEEQA